MDDDHTNFCVNTDAIVRYLNGFRALGMSNWVEVVHDLR